MDQNIAICLVCLMELQEQTEIVSLNYFYDENISYGDCIKFCLPNFVEILDKSLNSAVCSDCSIELEISYKFLKKLIHSQNILSQENAIIDSQEVLYEQETGPNDENDEECNRQSAEACVTEYIGETDNWKTEEIKEEQDSSSGDQDVIKLIITETDELKDSQTHCNEEVGMYEDRITDEEKFSQTHYNEEVGTDEDETHQQSVAGSNDDDLIEEIPYEEIEVYTNCSDTEKAPSEEKSILREPDVGGRRHGKYNCDHCGKLFPSQARLTAHRRCHEKHRTTFNCFECGRMYASDQALTVHVRTTHNKDGFTCPICSKVFFNERSLEIHTRYHQKEFPFDCKDCGKNFAQKGQLTTHQNVRHNGLRFICVFPNCNKLFNSSAALRDHEFSHNFFECQYCQEGYSSKFKLKTHICQVHNLELTLEELEPMRQSQRLI